jgi:hypothetical protein
MEELWTELNWRETKLLCVYMIEKAHTETSTRNRQLVKETVAGQAGYITDYTTTTLRIRSTIIVYYIIV